MTTMRQALDKIWNEADGARQKGADAYDSLTTELAKENPDANEVTNKVGAVYVESTKFFAGLLLAPLDIAKAIQDPTPDAE